MSADSQACPKCGAQLQRRLADLECAGCGWFKPGASGRSTGHGMTAGLSASGPRAAETSRLQAAVEQPSSTGSRLGSDGVAPGLDRAVHYDNPYQAYKIPTLIVLGLLFTAGNFSILFAIPGYSPDLRVLLVTLLGSAFAVGIAAAALYIDWAAAKLVVALLALGYIGLDALRMAQHWTKASLFVQGVHVLDAILLLWLAWLLYSEWRYENSAPEL